MDLLLHRQSSWTQIASRQGTFDLTLNILMETGRAAVGNIVRLEFEQESEVEMRET
jgi:hypothetical protein